jgi:hypothetical protein
MRVTGVSSGLIYLLVCGAVAAVPIDARADWCDQYDTVVYAGNGGSSGSSSGGWNGAATNGSWGSSGGSGGSSGGSWQSTGGSYGSWGR